MTHFDTIERIGDRCTISGSGGGVEVLPSRPDIYVGPLDSAAASPNSLLEKA